MRFELIEATSPFDSTIPIEIIILILLFCNFIFFTYHYFNLLFLNNKLKKLDIKNIDTNQNNFNDKNNIKHKFSRGFFFDTIEIINLISKSELIERIQLDSQLKKIENKIKYQISKRSKTFYFPIIAFSLFLIDILMKLNIMNSLFIQSKHPMSLFDFFNSLIGPIFIIFSFCFFNLMFSIWIFISARINFEKIEIQLNEKIIKYFETEEIIKKEKNLNDL